MRRLEGKVAFITGGAGGLGKAIAEGFVREGARVWLADLHRETVEQAAGAMGDGVHGIALDVTDLQSIEAAVSTVIAQERRIDILINGAGIFGLEPWLELTEKGFDTLFAVNVKGLAFVTQAVARHMAAGSGGSIINITSASGRQGNPNSVFYSASKMAVISLTQSAARGLAARRIRVNAIAPGGVVTPMWDSVQALYRASGVFGDGDIDRHMAAAIPLGRLSTPLDQVGAALFFASDDSAYVTGQTLNVDGGLAVN